MKVCVKISSREATNPIQMVLKAIVGQNTSLQIVETPKEAGLVVVNDITVALGLLKDDENIKILIATLPGTYGASTRAGVQGLLKAYPNRVIARPMVELEGEQNIVHFLTDLKEEAK
ncbi:MAG: hypothetical protein A2648_00135 [Candidatus Lloydbacteria bacterium RIFCSPHIGHO2_01_FULL_41_20]|uniref:Uncharacterized protein n=1 Tax=Candidatus Lloydbacteria bacterium RIFCSPHIGHO2_01_FULL_41_20 TaxID=1798657 RepID=A0A1G2CRX3_9BACT|nr:MAG: hypothetical protein A2648_00135 [Candidatus Lloydbacteria bacterium RIFCSPHIGHO2_01_FULL_41_20]